MQEKILDLLREIRPEADFDGSADFVEDGLLDSFDIVSLIDDLERQYGAPIPAQEILPENFSSLEAIAATVSRAQKHKG